MLRGPAAYSIGNRPTTFGEMVLRTRGFAGIELSLDQSVGDGILHVQCVLRGFSATTEAVEHVASISREVSPRDRGTLLKLPVAMDIGPGFEVVRLETWLHWTGAQPLPLAALPLTY